MLRAIRLILPAFCLLALALPIQAAVFTVTKTADTLDGACDRDCSLREAVSAANADEHESGADVVVVPPGIYVLTRTGPGEDGSATGDLDLNDQMILVGAGAGSTVLDGFGSDRVLDARAPAEIYGVTIRNGRVEGDGGALLVRANSAPQPVHLRRSVVSGNQAQKGGDGGGIATQGTLTVSESAILDNHAEEDGGGISAGGEEGHILLANVTVSGNRAAGSGGGLVYTVGQATILSSTVVFNHAQVSGGAISAQIPLIPGSFPPELYGSIVAQNTAPADADCGADSGGYNVLGAGEGCGLAPTDRSGTAAQPLRPVAETLSTGLGPTPVHALLEGSLALDMVPAPFCLPADQVGQARQDPCDAGAWEQVDRPLCVPGGSVLCLQDGRFRVSATWALDDRLPGAPAQGVPLTDDTGNYWFFAPDNLEVMVKVLDGCALNEHWWVFASGLTDVGVDLRVEDLETGRIWIFEHEAGTTFPPQLDTDALPCAPPANAALAEDTAGAPPPPAPLPADVLRVTKTADTNDGACDHDCSLREAVLAANASGRTRVILLGPGVHALSIPGAGEEAGHTGDLDVTKRLVILGAGARRTALDGGGIDRVLEVRPGGNLEIYDLTVRNGLSLRSSSDGTGGGILARGDLTLIRSAVESNAADEVGGGIWAFDRLTVRDSTISGNRSGTVGGGLGAGLVEMENVTISGNQAAQRGGGFYYPADTAVLRNVTITGNSAPVGAGVASSQDTCAGDIPCFGPLVLERTVIAGKTGGADVGSDCSDMPRHGGGFNVLGAGCKPGLDDLAGTPANPLDARLSPLGDHGGPTLTHVPLPGSPAIDLGPATSCLEADQRGRRRPADGDLDGSTLCDAGAVERLRGCQPDAETLCLGAGDRFGGDRFRARARWTARGATGTGKALPLAAFAGSFWFFDAANLELTVKVLDGCGVNDRFWVFLSGLTDVGVEVTVEDTVTGEIWTHSHAAGAPLQPRLDADALSCVNL